MPESMPESKPTELIKIPVVGTRFYDGRNHLALFKLKTSVELRLEPSNKFDKFAVEVGITTSDSTDRSLFVKLGYIPAFYSKIISTLIQNDIKLCATVMANDRQGGDPVSISISLA